MAPSSTSTPSHPKINKIFHRNSRQNAEHPPSSFGAFPDSSSSSTNHPPTTRRLSKRPSKIQLVDKPSPEENLESPEDVSAALTETPVIVEPPPIPIPEHRQPIPRAGRRSVTIDRPLTMTFPTYDPSYAQSSPTTARLSDISSRLSGWFSHSFAGSSTDLPLRDSLAPTSSSTTVTQPPATSPKHKTSAGILATARNPAKGLANPFEKAVRYIFDSDAQPDKCTDPIWLMGVQHPGYEPPSPGHVGHHRESTDVGARRSTPPTISKGSAGFHKNPSLQSLSLTLTSSSQSNGKQPLSWPPAFYEDFTSCIWMTYRSQYIPLRDITLAALEANAEVDPVTTPVPLSSPPRRAWWGGERSWTSDAGWGCMLRTGQSLLATALVQLHLGRGGYLLCFTSDPH